MVGSLLISKLIYYVFRLFIIILNYVFQDSFEGVSSVFKKGLTDDQTDVLYELLDTLQLEQVEILMETLFECIILTIDIPQRDEEFVDMSKFR